MASGGALKGARQQVLLVAVLTLLGEEAVSVVVAVTVERTSGPMELLPLLLLRRSLRRHPSCHRSSLLLPRVPLPRRRNGAKAPTVPSWFPCPLSIEFICRIWVIPACLRLMVNRQFRSHHT